MENTALLNFINEACKQDDTNIDVSIAELTSAIKTLEDEKRKRENKKRSILIGNFKKAYSTLRENHIRVSYLFDADYVNDMVDDISDDYVFDVDEADRFEFK